MSQVRILACAAVALCCTLGSPSPAQNVIPLTEIASRYGFPLFTQEEDKIRIAGDTTSMIFEADSRRLIFNGLLVWMNAPLVKTSAGFTVGEADAKWTITPLLRPVLSAQTPSRRVVLLDPGHGGEDTGAISPDGLQERRLTLDIARRVCRRLSHAHIASELTRDTDRTLTLQERVDLAVKLKACVLLSIHLNASANTNAAGIETYVLPAAGFPSTSGGNGNMDSAVGNQNNAANMRLAYHIQSAALSSTKSADRGIRHARFEVLRLAPCPAALVECGFVSNLAEEDRLNRRSYRDDLAAGIAAGIAAFVRLPPAPASP